MAMVDVLRRKAKPNMKQQTIVSRSGSRHIVGVPPGLKVIRAHAHRITTLCGFGIWRDDALLETMHDCEFCLAEAEVISKREAGNP
jgi:hypothetical protein